MTDADLLRLGRVAHLAVEASCERTLTQADLAAAYVTCAADLLDRGDLTHALQLCSRAGEVWPSYDQIHSNLGGSQ